MAHLKLNTAQWLQLGEKLGYIKEGKFLGMFGHKRRKFHGFGMRGENFEEMKKTYKKKMEKYNISDTMLADIVNLSEELGMKDDWRGGVNRLIGVAARYTSGSDRERIEKIRQIMLEEKRDTADNDSFRKEHGIKEFDAGRKLKELHDEGVIDDEDISHINRYWVNDFNISARDFSRIIAKGKEEGMSIRELTRRLKVMTSDKSIEPGTQGFFEHLFSPISGE